MRAAIRRNPKDATAHLNLGILLEKRGNHAEAEAIYREALRVDPKDARLHWDLADVLEKRGDLDGAMHEMREYIRKGNPDNDGEERLAELRAKKAA